MDRRIYNSLIENASYNVKIWIKIASILMVSNLLLTFFIISLNTREKTIVIPPDFNREFWVQGNEVSPLYIEQMANYFFQLLLTYNKQNVLHQYKTLLKYFGPNEYGKIQSFLMADAERVQRNDLGSAFYPMAIKVNGMNAEIEGEHVGFIGSQIVTKKLKKYKMTFGNDQGPIKIISYEEITPENKN